MKAHHSPAVKTTGGKGSSSKACQNSTRKPLNLQIGSFPFLRLTHLKVKHIGGSMQIPTMLLKTFLCCTRFEDRPTADEQALLVVNAIMISCFADEKNRSPEEHANPLPLCRHCRLVEHQNLQIWEATPPTKGPYRSAPDTNPIPSLMVTCHKCLATLEYNLKCGRCGVHVVKSTTLSPHGQVGLLVVRRFFRSKTPLNHLTDKVQDRHKVYSSDAIGELWKNVR